MLPCTKAEFDNSFHTASTFAFGKLMARCVSAKKSLFVFCGQNIPIYQAIFNHSLPICNLIESPCF